MSRHIWKIRILLRDGGSEACVIIRQDKLQLRHKKEWKITQTDKRITATRDNHFQVQLTTQPQNYINNCTYSYCQSVRWVCQFCLFVCFNWELEPDRRSKIMHVPLLCSVPIVEIVWYKTNALVGKNSLVPHLESVLKPDFWRNIFQYCSYNERVWQADIYWEIYFLIYIIN